VRKDRAQHLPLVTGGHAANRGRGSRPLATQRQRRQPGPQLPPAAAGPAAVSGYTGPPTIFPAKTQRSAARRSRLSSPAAPPRSRSSLVRSRSREATLGRGMRGSSSSNHRARNYGRRNTQAAPRRSTRQAFVRHGFAASSVLFNSRRVVTCAVSWTTSSPARSDESARCLGTPARVLP
jgi:hypothetical protein